MEKNLKIGIVGGGGWLGGVIIDALLAARLVTAEQIGISYRSAEPGGSPAAFKTKDSQSLAEWADVVIVSVRPQDWPALKVAVKGKLAISIMAAISLEQLTAGLGTDRVVRALPNVAAQVGRSYTPWVASSGVTAEDRALVTRILEVCGTADEVATDAQIDYLTGLTGSGPAFLALLAEALGRDAAAHGIPAEIARRATRELMIGAGRLLETGSETTEKIVDDFVAYRGVIAAAIDAMRAAGFDTAVQSGMAAALKKSLSLGKPASSNS